MGMPVAITIAIVVARRVAIAIAIMAVMRVAVVRSGMHEHTDYTPNILGARGRGEASREHQTRSQSYGEFALHDLLLNFAVPSDIQRGIRTSCSFAFFDYRLKSTHRSPYCVARSTPESSTTQI